MQYIPGLVIGLAFLLFGISLYIAGQKQGYEWGKNERKPTFNPIQTVKREINKVKQEKEENTIIDGFNNMMSYDPTKVGE